MLWPSVIEPSQELESMTRMSKGSVWVEVNLSCRSLAPAAGHHLLCVVYDRRAWSYVLMSRSHSPRAREVFLSLKSHHESRHYSPSALREMLRLSSDMRDDDEVGVVLFVLWATGGVSTLARTPEAAIQCSNIPEAPLKVYERSVALLPFMLSVDYDDEQCIRHVVQDMKESNLGDRYHLNVNWTRRAPSVERISDMASSLNRRGVSWSFSFAQRHLAKELAKTYRSCLCDQTTYVSSEPL
jgi:hypothetical protein